jgi:transposase
MKEQDLQAAALLMHQRGQSKRAIARSLSIDVKTVRAIINAGAVKTVIKPREDKVNIDEQVLERLYHECQGYIERMHEKLTEEHNVAIGYSTLSRLVRSKGLGKPPDKRSAHVPDLPGEEMQHDTSVYSVHIGGVKRKVICSGIYLRYSKMRYIRFYYRFNRFVMKCFIDEALRHWGYCARTCIVDNTNLAILYGTGSKAVMNPEMVAFANNYGFVWYAHELRHSNRKAGKERDFYTVETNFLPGRTFSSLENMNEQAIQWAAVRYAHRPQAHTKLIPVELFECEKPSLLRLPEFISAPYLPLKRRVDEYGYVVVDVNYYWVPQSIHDKYVTVLRYAHHISIMNGTTELLRYKLPPAGVKNQKYVPEGMKQQPRGFPKDRKLGCEQEEKHLREIGEPVREYLDFIKCRETVIGHKPAFIRSLYTLSRKLGLPLFLQTIERVFAYRVKDIAIVERTAQQLLKTAFADVIPSIETGSDYNKRQAYLDGRFTEENPSGYDNQSE